MRVKTCVVCIAFAIILLRVHPTGSGTFRSIFEQLPVADEAPLPMFERALRSGMNMTSRVCGHRTA